MKLRDRRKFALPNIKQEDCKPITLPNARLSNATAMDGTNIFDLTIKQEDSKDHKVLLEQDGDHGKEEYCYQCDLCKMKVANITSVLEHRTLIHGIKQSSNRLIKNINIEPDMHDPDFHCKSCERGYRDSIAYRNHLRQVHYMIFKPMPRWKTQKNDIVPDPNDTSFYCRACDFTYKRKDNYRRHCRYAHGLKSVKFANRMPSSISVLDTYCQACDVRLSSIHSYRRHLFGIHKADSRSIQQKRSDIMPNVNDPNFYCRSCEKKLTNKYSFRQHLMHVHSIFGSAPKRGKLKPDADDPNNHCRACQKTYISKGRYRRHLRLAHQMTLTPLQGNVDRKHLPDPYNPDYCCSVCKKTYASLTLHRKHCKQAHFMELNHASILNPQADINVDDPKLYCAQCERSYGRKAVFKKHLARVHSI